MLYGVQTNFSALSELPLHSKHHFVQLLGASQQSYVMTVHAVILDIPNVPTVTGKAKQNVKRRENYVFFWRARTKCNLILTPLKDSGKYVVTKNVGITREILGPIIHSII